jgi:hypothetical protein
MDTMIDEWKDTDKHNFGVEFIKYLTDTCNRTLYLEETTQLPAAVDGNIQVEGQVMKIYGEDVDKLYINFGEKLLIIKISGGCGYYKIGVEKELSDFIKINRNKKLEQLGI